MRYLLALLTGLAIYAATRAQAQEKSWNLSAYDQAHDGRARQIEI